MNEAAIKVRLAIQPTLKRLGFKNPHQLWQKFGGSKSTPTSLWEGEVDAIQFNTIERLLRVVKDVDEHQYQSMRHHLNATNLFEVIEGHSSESVNDVVELCAVEASHTLKQVKDFELPRNGYGSDPPPIETDHQRSSFGPALTDLAPNFVKLYCQAAQAYEIGLADIASVALASSFEILIRDFAVYLHSSEESLIRQCEFRECVEKFIQDPNLKKCCELLILHTSGAFVWSEKRLQILQQLNQLAAACIGSFLSTEKSLKDLWPD